MHGAAQPTYLSFEVVTRLLELDWLARESRTRALRLTDTGQTNLPLRLGVRLP
jgi:hypothetical protein